MNARSPGVIATGVLTVLFLAQAASAADDVDGDGISAANEEILGTDPASSEPLQLVLDDGLEPEDRRRQPGYDPTKDVLSVEFCHVGEDRYLWRVTLAAPPRPDDTVLHLYVDADADASTGRKEAPTAPNAGTEYMLTMAAGQGRSTLYDPDGKSSSGPPITYAVEGDALVISADVPLGRDDRGVRYALYVLCHTTTEGKEAARMSDSTAKRQIADVPLSTRKKILRPGDYRENHQVDATFGHGLLQAVLSDEAVLVVPHDRLETDGLSVDLGTSQRWPHLRLDEPGGRAWTTPPAAGRYHVGFLMYDDSSDERVGLYIDGSLLGVAVANQDNNTEWLYWLRDARDFRGGERVELRALGSGGRHGIANVVFLPRPPEIRRVHYAVENMVARGLPDHPGQVIVSWTTTWPSPTRFEYGGSAQYGRLVENEAPCLVHRVVLEGLDPQATYHGRATCMRRDGSPVLGDDFVFRASGPPLPDTQTQTTAVPLALRNPHPFRVEDWPITTGVPVPQGRLGRADHVRLVGPAGEVPAQVAVTARWPDGSVKWLLVSFQAAAAAEAEVEYRLEFGRSVRPVPVSDGLSVSQDASGVAIDTGAISFRIDSHGNLADFRRGGRDLIPPGSSVRSQALDDSGTAYTTAESDARIEVEESGPLRAVVKATSRLAAADGSRLARIEKRVEAYRGAAFLRVHHTLLVDSPEKFANFKELSYSVPVAAGERTWRVALENDQAIVLDDSVAPDNSTVRGNLPPIGVRQRFDDEIVTIAAHGGESPRPARLAGSIAAAGEGGWAVAVRDCWQNYPKAFLLRPENASQGARLDVGLLPPFDAGLYDKFPFEKEGHHLYYYLLDGCYRLKQGVAKTHELLLSFDDEPRQGRLCAVFQRPLLATAAPAWYCGSKAFYDVAARNLERFRLYEEAIDKNLAAYASAQRRQRDFGLLNYGDWYGERGSNWGNVEYDTQHAFFLEYIRSGNPDAFFLGHATELHNRDVDTVQWSEDPGMMGAVYVHQMCHVGEYYDESVPDTLGFPRGGYTVSHAWVEGHFGHYFLTGDRRSLETGSAVADYFARQELRRPYDFSSVRTPGWHLIMNAAALAATGDPYYENASKVIVERVLELQDALPVPLPEHQTQGRTPYQIGGWSRMMVPGHCHCEPRHRGNAGFMVAVLLSGLKYYHDTSGDERVKEAIIRGAHYLLDETYSDAVRGFRYTSCPQTDYRPGASPLMVEGVARAYLWTGDERFRRVLTEALPLSAQGSSYGKGFSMYYRMAPRVLADLEAVGIRFDEPKGGSD